MNENMVTITLEEYTKLNRTAWKFELLRKEAKKRPLPERPRKSLV